MKFRGSDERHIRPVRVAVEVEILLGDDFAELTFLDTDVKQPEQKITKEVMVQGVARYFD